MRYGANGSYVYRSLSDGIFCSNSVFGDPAPGAVKQCAIGGGSSSTTTNWSVCASEGGLCAFSGTQQVRYGANGSYVYRSLSDGIFCSNSVFGDPAPGAVKQCSIGRDSVGAAAAPASPGRLDLWAASEHHVPGRGGEYLAWYLDPVHRQPIPSGDDVLSARRGAFADQLDQAEDAAIPSSASTARSSTAPAGVRAMTRRPRSGRTTKTSTT